MKRFKEIGLIGAITVLLLLLLEGGVRLFAPQHIKTSMLEGRSLAVEDSLLGHRNRPGAVARQHGPEFTTRYVINEQGLRDRSVAGWAERDSSRSLRVLLLGDSFTFGIGSDYEAIWPTFFAQTLDARGLDVEVINAGVPGYDTRSEVRYLEHFWSRFNPDWVVLTLLPHDLFTNAPLLQADTTTATRNAVVRRGEKAPGFHVVALLQRLLLGSDWVYSQVYRRSGRAAIFEAPFSENVRTRYETTTALLRRASAFCRQRQVPFLVFSLPQQFQVLVEARRYDVGQVDVRTVDRTLSRAVAGDSLPWVAALDTLARAYRQEGTDLYFRSDGHLTPAGNRVVGRYLAGRFEEIVKERYASTRVP